MTKENLERLEKAIIERLEERKEIQGIARELAGRIQERLEEEAYLGKHIGGKRGHITICNSAPPPADFQCDTKVYNCDGKANFQCESAFKAKEGFYQCGDFNCPTPFTCLSKTGFDFICTDFVCPGTFKCDAGHVFLCTNSHECQTTYSGEAGDKDCTKTNPYNLPKGEPGGGTDTDPGDEMCGYRGKGNFKCSKDFTCKAKDDFDCWGATFKCAKGGFTCTKGTNFKCFNSYTTVATTTTSTPTTTTPP